MNRQAAAALASMPPEGDGAYVRDHPSFGQRNEGRAAGGALEGTVLVEDRNDAEGDQAVGALAAHGVSRPTEEGAGFGTDARRLGSRERIDDRRNLVGADVDRVLLEHRQPAISLGAGVCEGGNGKQSNHQCGAKGHRTSSLCRRLDAACRTVLPFGQPPATRSRRRPTASPMEMTRGRGRVPYSTTSSASMRIGCETLK